MSKPGAYYRCVRRSGYVQAAVLCCVAVIASACSSVDSGSGSVGELTATTLGGSTDLEQALSRFVGEGSGGAVALTVCSGVEHAAAVGVANADGRPLTPDTPFRAGSISKTFVGAMILQLVDEGRIDLDQPLSLYLPDAIVGGDVTVRSLLTHRSGIPDVANQPAFFDDVFAERDRVFTPDEVLAYIAGLPTGTPDTSYSYSNTNYVLLGQVIETLDGVDVNTALQERISDPLGLDATVFASSGTVPDSLAAGWSIQGHIVSGDPNVSYDSIATSAFAAGALVSTADDLRHFLVALFEGDLFSESALAEGLNATSADGYGFGLGLGTLGPDGPAWRSQTPAGQSQAYGHNGTIFGYSAAMLIEPATGNIVIVLTNTDRLIADSAVALVSRAAGCDQSDRS